MILLYKALDTTVILQYYVVMHERVTKSSRMVSNAVIATLKYLHNCWIIVCRYKLQGGCSDSPKASGNICMLCVFEDM